MTTTKPIQPYFKGKGEHSVNELEKMCQQYKDYISHINSQPKEEVDVWEAKYKALLDSHNELLMALIEVRANRYAINDYHELINKAKNVTL